MLLTKVLKAQRIKAAQQLVFAADKLVADEQFKSNSFGKRLVTDMLCEALSIYIFLNEKEFASTTLDKICNFLLSLIDQKKCSVSATATRIVDIPATMFTTKKSCNEEPASSNKKACAT